MLCSAVVQIVRWGLNNYFSQEDLEAAESLLLFGLDSFPHDPHIELEMLQIRLIGATNDRDLFESGKASCFISLSLFLFLGTPNKCVFTPSLSLSFLFCRSCRSSRRCATA